MICGENSMTLKEENKGKTRLQPDIGIYSRPYFGERKNGDWAFIVQANEIVFIAIVDGTGHGLKANNVSSIVKRYIKEKWDKDLNLTMKHLHSLLSSTLGAAISLATINLKTAEFEYLGVGNTVCRKIGKKPMRFISVEGVVGLKMRNPNLQKEVLEEGDILFFYTDGVKDSFNVNNIPNIATHSATYTSKNIVQTYGSQYDDSTCIVIKISYAS